VGYYTTAEFLVEAVKSPPRIQEAFRKHVCAVTYIPSPSSCTTEALARQYGTRLHDSSGNRIGFAFVHRSVSKPIPENRWYPKAETVERRWSSYFGRSHVDTVAIDPRFQPVSPAANALMSLARQLGISRHAPCLLIIWLPRGPKLYCYPLGAGTPSVAAQAFDRFASLFYDANAASFNALAMIERLLQESVIPPSAIRDFESRLKSRTEYIDRLARKTVLDSADRQSVFELAAQASQGALTSDLAIPEGLDGLDPPQELSALLVDAAKLAEICVDLETIRAFLSGSVSRGTSFNGAFARARAADEALLHMLSSLEI
jgi:hypothetical protein